MPFPTGLKVLGGGLSAITEGLTRKLPELQEQADERRYEQALRPLDLEAAQLRLRKIREELEHPKPYVTRYGVYQFNPQTRQYEFHATPEQQKLSAKEAEMGAVAQWLDEPEGSPRRRYAESYLGKMQAPAVSAQARADLVDPRKRQWAAQQQHWQALEGIARSRNSTLAGHYADQRQYWEGLLKLREQAADKDPKEVAVIEAMADLLLHGTEPEKDLARNWVKQQTLKADTARDKHLHDINKEQRAEEKHELTMQTAQEKLTQLRQKGGANLDAKLKGELERLEQQVAALKARGETLGPYLTARFQKLDESITQAQERAAAAANREQRAAQQAPLHEQDIRGRIKGREQSKNEITIQDGLTTHRLRGKDVDLFQTFTSRFTGDAKKDAATIQGLPRHHERLIGRLAYQEKYKKALPADTGALPTPEPEPKTAAPQPDALSADEQTTLMRAIGLPEPDSTGDKFLQGFLVRLKGMPIAQALEGYKALKTPEERQAFKIAFLDVYKRRPPE